jgi:hypothetical protein
MPPPQKRFTSPLPLKAEIPFTETSREVLTDATFPPPVQQTYLLPFSSSTVERHSV